MTGTILDIGDTAIFSPDRIFRYALFRYLKNEGKTLNVIGVNPSKADEKDNDNTARRVIGFGEDLGFARIVITNLFGFCATDPRDMKAAKDPVGPENDKYLRKWAEESDVVIAAWGIHGGFRSRDDEVIKALTEITDLMALRETKAGFPSHPLYLPRDLKPYLWRPARCWLCGGAGIDTIITVECETPGGKGCPEKDVAVHHGCYMDMDP